MVRAALETQHSGTLSGPVTRLPRCSFKELTADTFPLLNRIYAMRPASAGSTGRYDWKPPHMNSQAEKACGCAAVPLCSRPLRPALRIPAIRSRFPALSVRFEADSASR